MLSIVTIPHHVSFFINTYLTTQRQVTIENIDYQ